LEEATVKLTKSAIIFFLRQSLSASQSSVSSFRMIESSPPPCLSSTGAATAEFFLNWAATADSSFYSRWGAPPLPGSIRSNYFGLDLQVISSSARFVGSTPPMIGSLDWVGLTQAAVKKVIVSVLLSRLLLSPFTIEQ
jgi:hypothetical protein